VKDAGATPITVACDGLEAALPPAALYALTVNCGFDPVKIPAVALLKVHEVALAAAVQTVAAPVRTVHFVIASALPESVAEIVVGAGRKTVVFPPDCETVGVPVG